MRFGAVVVGATIRRLIDEGFLVRPRYFATTPEKIDAALSEVAIVAGDFQSGGLSHAMRSKAIMGDVVGTWQRRGENRQTIAFCVDKQHARDLAGEFVSVGVRADVLLDDTKDDVRAEIFAAFDARRLRVLCSVGVLSIGFDSPVASCAILARPTLSLSSRPARRSGVAPLCGQNGCVDSRPRRQHRAPRPVRGFHAARRSVDGRPHRRSQAPPRCGAGMGLPQLRGGQSARRRHLLRVRQSPSPRIPVVVVDGELDEDVDRGHDYTEARPGELQTFYQYAHWYGKTKEMRNPPGWAWYATQRRFRIPPALAHDAVPYRWRDLPPLPPDAATARWFRADWQRQKIAARYRQEASAC